MRVGCCRFDRSSSLLRRRMAMAAVTQRQDYKNSKSAGYTIPKGFSGQLGTAWRQQDVCTLKQIDPRYILASCTAPRHENAGGRLSRLARHLCPVYQRPNRHSALCVALQWHHPPTRTCEPAQPRQVRSDVILAQRGVAGHPVRNTSPCASEGHRRDTTNHLSPDRTRVPCQ